MRAAVVPPHHQDRRADARLAQLDPLFEERDAEAVGAGALERARDGGGAVSVAVGLEDGPDARVAGVALDGAEVVAEGCEVDLGARGTHGVGRGGAARAQERASHRTKGAARPSRGLARVLSVTALRSTANGSESRGMAFSSR